MKKAESPRFVRLDDGAVQALDGFPPVILVSGELLQFRDGAHLVGAGFRRFEIRCINGTGRYRLLRMVDRRGRGTFEARRIA